MEIGMETHGRDTHGDALQRSGSPKKPRIHKEPEKVEHTTHWDMDYLPLKEVEALYAGAEVPIESEAHHRAWLKRESLIRFFKRLPLWLIVLIVILLFGRFVITALFHFIA